MICVDELLLKHFLISFQLLRNPGGKYLGGEFTDPCSVLSVSPVGPYCDDVCKTVETLFSNSLTDVSVMMEF